MGYYELLSMKDEAITYKLDYDSTPPFDCPNDGVTLLETSDGILFCPFDGWRFEGWKGVSR